MDICYPETTDWSAYGTQEQIDALNEDRKALAEAFAWYLLASLCAYRIGVCPITVRPCAARGAPAGSWVAAPVSGIDAIPFTTIGRATIYTGNLWLTSCGCGAGACSCQRLSEVILPGPVGDIVSVSIGEEVVDPSRYRVDDGNRLLSTDPDLTWPATQDMHASPGEDGAFAVTYYRGAAPSALVNAAAGILAAEFYRSLDGDSKCRLPKGVTRVNRGGTSYEVDNALFADGTTKIREVDAVIHMYNPSHLKQPPRVLSPDAPSVRRTTVGPS